MEDSFVKISWAFQGGAEVFAVGSVNVIYEEWHVFL